MRTGFGYSLWYRRYGNIRHSRSQIYAVRKEGLHKSHIAVSTNFWEYIYILGANWSHLQPLKSSIETFLGSKLGLNQQRNRAVNIWEIT